MKKLKTMSASLTLSIKVFCGFLANFFFEVNPIEAYLLNGLWITFEIYRIVTDKLANKKKSSNSILIDATIALISQSISIAVKWYEESISVIFPIGCI